MKTGTLKREEDRMGFALSNFKNKNGESKLDVLCDKAEDETYDLAYFFRSYDTMPETEQMALDLAKGKVLDVGSGTGIHALVLQEKGLDVKAIDISPFAVDLAKQMGVNTVFCQNFYDLQQEKYDTLLFLMNGIGLVETLDGFEMFFAKCDELLSADGQILFDSSDLIYLYEEEDGSYRIDLNDSYYGEVQFQVEYQGKKGDAFRWLFIDFANLSYIAEQFGFQAELVFEDEHYNYLARIIRMPN
ncbi:MAG: methyltransferase domain-containing protein [Bacteroidales bacterium]|nr:methyltransferase domain-containing protein [Bacteroidales bacterium]